MKIDGININMPAVKGQIESTANNNAGTSGKSANGKAESLVALNIDSSIKGGLEDKQQNRGQIGQAHSLREIRLKDKQQNRDKQAVTAGNGLFDLKAVFALDKEKNVVIRFLDQKGKVVKQVPPEEYINMVKKFKENVESLFSEKV
ncbi:flagellar protein FlaG [Dissulfurispira sp.]|uniref:flagellar protein FlaG n=1 Tax=Dissulfurispira sp. TaxID=2817609 RepID=UPI002FD92930